MDQNTESGWKPDPPRRRKQNLDEDESSKPLDCLLMEEFDIRTVIGDAHCARRRKQGLAAPLRKALDRAARAVKSQSGKALLRQRGMHLERSFEHVLDEGGMRRATLRGEENLTKRHKIAAACFNLSLLLRTLLGVEPQNNGSQAPVACFRLLSLAFTGKLCAFARTRNIILLLSGARWHFAGTGQRF